MLMKTEGKNGPKSYFQQQLKLLIWTETNKQTKNTLPLSSKPFLIGLIQHKSLRSSC